MIEHELDRYWQTVVSTIQDGIMIVNKFGVIVSVNNAFERITQYSQEELIGKTCQALNCDICDTVWENNNGHWCALFRNGELKKRECTIIRKDGRRVHVLKNASILHNDKGEAIGAVETLSDITELIRKDHQIEAYKRELRSAEGFYGLIGSSPTMQQVYDLMTNAAQSDAPVIIYGESGTGKELVAKAIHKLSTRMDKPYIKVNCAALTESLLESELFGHVKGAYTGAYRDRLGRFETANGGSIFLDEIGDLPLSTQVKLLRVLEEKTIERVGDIATIAVDTRVISATNRDLAELVQSHAFREDFYFRINVIPIHLPPLRDRGEDIHLLAEFFFRKIRRKNGKKIKSIGNRTMDLLMQYTWPGNVRELKSAFEYACVTCNESLIRPNHLPPAIVSQKPKDAAPRKKRFNREDIKKIELIEALTETGGNQSKAAELLGITRVTVWNRMRRYGINLKREMNQSTGTP
jgi:two-component system, NtrC family, response regulator HydG